MPENMAQKTAPGPASPMAAARNLRERVVSGVVMVLVALAMAYTGPIAFAFLIVAVALVMSWEWGHLVRATSADAAFAVHGTAVIAAIGLATGGLPVLALVAIVAGTVAMLAASNAKRPALSAIGVPYVGLPAVALVWLRHDESNGFAAVIFLFLIVWTTDTMAFVFGRTIGGAKLCPSISPNKTWAGFLGGVVSSAILAGAFAGLISGASSLRLGMIGFALGVIAQMGDLAESAFKRTLGVKDASHLIPGHGGVMDRMDGVVTVALAAAIFALFWNENAPALALLIGG